MKKSILLLFFGLFFLSGCSTTNKLSQSELFEKKQQCEKYESQMKIDAQKYYGEIYIGITSIFYSPERNSCLYIVHFDHQKLSSDSFDMSIEVHDFLTKESLGIATPENIKKLKE